MSDRFMKVLDKATGGNSVDSVVRGLTDTIEKLNDLSQKHKQKAIAWETKMIVAEEEMNFHDAEADRAEKIAERIEGLLR